jgi:hypothetical protein
MIATTLADRPDPEVVSLCFIQPVAEPMRDNLCSIFPLRTISNFIFVNYGRLV